MKSPRVLVAARAGRVARIAAVALGLAVGTALAGCSAPPLMGGDAGDGGGLDGSMAPPDGNGFDVPRFDVARDTAPICPGVGTQLAGTVTTPNGLDPIPGVLVYVLQGDAPPIGPGVACDTCNVPPNALGSAVTGVDGSFTIPHAFDAGGSVSVVIQKGRFRRVVHLTATDCSPHALTADQTRLPGTSGTDVTLPKILVASMVNDDIGSVLTRIGITEFDTMDGCRRAATAADITACPLGALLADMTRLRQYNIVLLPCGALGNFHTWQVLPPAIATNLQEFLRAGGRIYASDLSYGVVQRTFPAAFTFAGGTTLSQNGNDPADVGLGGSRAMPASYEGIIDDADLHTWMNARGALLPNGHVQLTEFINPWGAVASAPATATTWVHGAVQLRDATGGLGAAMDRPLTVESEYREGGGCGRVVFTSYHTTSAATGTLTPQERVLEWLLFELGGCAAPG